MSMGLFETNATSINNGGGTIIAHELGHAFGMAGPPDPNGAVGGRPP